MNKPTFWQLSGRDQRALFSEASERLSIPAHMVEKDAGVCWTLRELFTLPDARAHFIFKGWNLAVEGLESHPSFFRGHRHLPQPRMAGVYRSA